MNEQTLKKRGLTTFALVMLITGAVDSIRNLPATALFGTALIFFFIFSAVVFLIPTALVSAELASNGDRTESGVYSWVKSAFGEKFAFLAIWLQWITNLVWFPTILSFTAGLIAYLFDPALSQNKFFLVGVILSIFWFLTIINLRGLTLSSKFTSFCAIFGMVIPMILIISLSVVWIVSGKPIQIHLTASNIFPTLNNVNTWVSLTAIMTAFAGMELSAVHIRDIRDPQHTYPRALFISVWLIIITMMLGALAIAFVLPQSQINLVNGVMQAFTAFLQAYHLTWAIPLVTLMILIGTFGGIVSWVISPARGLLQAAKLGYLPPLLSKENKHGVASNLLIMQAIIVSIVCCAFLFMPSVSGSYWLLTALSTQLYMLMYVLMFATGIYLRYKEPNRVRNFKIPGGTFGMWFTCLLGFVGCTITLIVGFFPPDGLDVGSVMHYEMTFGSGMLMMILPILFFYFYKSRTQKVFLQGAEQSI